MIKLEELRQEIKHITPRKKLFTLLKQELSLLGYWKIKPRGNPSAGGKAKYLKYGSIYGKKE